MTIAGPLPPNLTPGEMDAPAPIIKLAPPTPEVRDAVVRHLIRLFARHALIDLGVLPANEGASPK
ncbi:MAG: hypothetical protein IPH44_08970 [Myxococcales bacterium]|nr:hypothetical protein [Myxococcales bacterium]MBK7198680.1 hypothetical protein [Myxococcales bacterium]